MKRHLSLTQLVFHLIFSPEKHTQLNSSLSITTFKVHLGHVVSGFLQVCFASSI